MAFDWIKRFLGDGRGPDEPPMTSPSSETEIAAVAVMAQRMVDVVGESMQIAHGSKNIETRRSRVRVARDTIRRLTEMARQEPRLTIERVADVERDLLKIDLATNEMEALLPHDGPSQKADTRSGWHIGNPDAPHPYAFGTDHPASEMFDCLEFHATHQLRTPKRILERDGQRIPLTDQPPLDFEPWMGVWFPVRSRNRFDGGPNRVASDAGQVDPAEYRPFLLAIRSVAEDASATIGDRVDQIEAVCRQPAWSAYAAAVGGAERICGWFFPESLTMIYGLSHAARIALSAAGISTIAGLRNVSDADLLSFKGIGPAKLAVIRTSCASFDGDPDAVRLVNVSR